MIYKTLFTTLLIFCMTLNSIGQEALLGGQEIVSPEINDDQSVTLRLMAPKADTVQVTGDFLPTVKVNTPYGEMQVPGNANMIKDEKGLWTYTSDGLNPELYGYSF